MAFATDLYRMGKERQMIVVFRHPWPSVDREQLPAVFVDFVDQVYNVLHKY
jgi:hypothetical protein